MSDMQGRVALVTGASSGIGRATAEAFALMGVRVVVAARRHDELATLVAEIEARGGEASAVRVDVSEPSDVRRMVEHTIETWGRLDVAVNDAGIEGPLGDITELADEDWDRVLDTNLRGAFLCLKYEARAMLAAGNGGAIVVLGSDDASYITGTTLTPDGGFMLTE
jgi:NAD(P)-dependent dehydrogenase (short-subunit alcohol dehydrogenase family)